MELEGAKRCFSSLQNDEIRIDTFISDRHKGIAKWIRTSQTSTAHFFDIWHVLKNITKKMALVAKEKWFQIIGEWIKWVRNHIYWAATTTKSGFGELIAAKYSTFMRHVADKHKDHFEDLFKNCTHGNLEKRDWIYIGNYFQFTCYCIMKAL